MLAAGLAAALRFLLAESTKDARARGGPAFVLLGALSWILLLWVRRVPVPPGTLPQAPTREQAVALFAAGVLLGAVAFAFARGGAWRGAAFGSATGAIGWCASFWPRLSRAIAFSGGIFAGPFLSALLETAFAVTVAAVAAALLREDLRRYAFRLIVAAAGVWTLATGAAQVSLTRWWGLGPDTLAEAAGIEATMDAGAVSIVRLAPRGGRAIERERVRMTGSGVELSPENLAKMDRYLRRADYRDVFASQALAELRRGWLRWWDADRALDAMMISVPGRVPPDYRGALDLIKVGPMNAERFEKLERLSGEASASSAGLEGVAQSQFIFEGFAAAYARFGDEVNTRKWRERLGNLIMVSEKRFEISPLESFREGRISGALQIDGRPADSVLVGLFQIWRTSPSASGLRLLSASRFPDARGRFAFGDLGPGEYELALLGRADDLSGRFSGVPGRLEIGSDHPEAELPAIAVARGAAASFPPSSGAAGALPENSPPEALERPLPWRVR